MHISTIMISKINNKSFNVLTITFINKINNIINILLKHYHDYEQNEYSLYIAKTIQDRT